MDYSKLSEEELEKRIEDVKNTELFVDLIIERNKMLTRGEINNPIYKAYEEEIALRKKEFDETKGRSR